MKIYTKTGDNGTTMLFGGGRVSKAHLRIETYGTIDELNSYVGLVRDSTEDSILKNVLKGIQDRLFSIGANLAANPDKEKLRKPEINENDIILLEQEMDNMDEKLPQLQHFILPGGHVSVSFCHITRCVCRRAERLCVALAEQEYVADIIIKYLNRLSDYFFVLSRYIAFGLNIDEIKWTPFTDKK